MCCRAAFAEDETAPEKEDWELPEPSRAGALSPRIFLSYEDGTAVEVLTQSRFAHLKEEHNEMKNSTRSFLEEKVVGGEEGQDVFRSGFAGATAFSFLEVVAPPKPSVVPRAVVPRQVPKLSSNLRSLKALPLPTKLPEPLPIPDNVQYPRISAMAADVIPPTLPPLVSTRLVMAYPKMDAHAVSAALARLADYYEARAQAEAVGPETYEVDDQRVDLELQAATELASLIETMREDTLDHLLQEERDTADVAKEKEIAVREQRSVDAMHAAEVKKVWSTYDPPELPPWASFPRPVPGMTLSYFKSKEGHDATERGLDWSLKSTASRTGATLPPPVAPEDVRHVLVPEPGQAAEPAAESEEEPEEDASPAELSSAYEAEEFTPRDSEPLPGAPTVNERYIELEADVRANVRNSSAQLIAAAGGVSQQFDMLPPILVLGAVPPGAVVSTEFSVQNVSPDIGRIRVSGASEGVSTASDGGPLAAGMRRKVAVTVVAPQEPGPFEASVYMTSEFNKYVVAIQATVAPDVDATVSDVPTSDLPPPPPERVLDETKPLEDVKIAEEMAAASVGAA